MESIRKCISGKRGVTLVEVTAAMLIMAIAAIGLGNVYVMALEQWSETALQIRSQQDGTAIMAEVVRSLQAASSIKVKDNIITARYQIPDLNIDSSTVFQRNGAALEKNGLQFFPLPGIEVEDSRRVAVKTFVLVEPSHPDSLYRLNLVLAVQYKEKIEDLDLTTAFCLRNIPTSALASAGGNP